MVPSAKPETGHGAKPDAPASGEARERPSQPEPSPPATQPTATKPTEHQAHSHRPRGPRIRGPRTHGHQAHQRPTPSNASCADEATGAG